MLQKPDGGKLVMNMIKRKTVAKKKKAPAVSLKNGVHQLPKTLPTPLIYYFLMQLTVLYR